MVLRPSGRIRVLGWAARARMGWYYRHPGSRAEASALVKKIAAFGSPFRAEAWLLLTPLQNL